MPLTACPPIGFQRPAAENFRQTAGADPTGQIHLKKPVLTMEKAGGVGGILFGGRPGPRHTIGIPGDGQRFAKPCHRQRTVRLRQGRPPPPPPGSHGSQQQEQQRQGRPREQPAQAHPECPAGVHAGPVYQCRPSALLESQHEDSAHQR